MTLVELLSSLREVDHNPYTTDPNQIYEKQIVFDTIGASGLYLLSVYYSEDDDLIHIDVGD